MIDALPPDQFDVVVENDMDAARLLWLVNRIGIDKLRNSVDKYKTRWPDSKPFVSTLLRWYRLKVPVAVYAPVRIPVYWLYLIYLRDGREVKIGMTGGWPARVFAYAYPYKQVADVFDVHLSLAFLVGGSRAEVQRRETALKQKFAPYRISGHTEWFAGHVWDELLTMAYGFDGASHSVVQTLSSALENHGRLSSLATLSVTND